MGRASNVTPCTTAIRAQDGFLQRIPLAVLPRSSQVWGAALSLEAWPKASLPPLSRRQQLRLPLFEVRQKRRDSKRVQAGQRAERAMHAQVSADPISAGSVLCRSLPPQISQTFCPLSSRTVHQMPAMLVCSVAKIRPSTRMYSRWSPMVIIWNGKNGESDSRQGRQTRAG